MPVFLFFLIIIVFSPTVVEQLVFPRFNIGQDFWQMKDFVNKNIPQNAIVQTTPDFTPAGIYLLERKIIYSPYGWLFYPQKNQMEQTRQEMIAVFTGTAEEAMALIKKYQIDYILIQNAGEFKSASSFEKVFNNRGYLIYKTGRFHF